MTKTKPVIVLTGGGSGGHIVPLVSLAHELKQISPASQIIYIGHKGDRFDSLNLPKHDFDFLAFINGGKFRRYHGESLLAHLLDTKTIALNVRDFFRVIKSIGAAYRLLGKVRAEVVFAKGGFISVPVGLAARIRGIPVITHDSDALGGLANRIVGRWARIKTTGMPISLYEQGRARLEYVGIPLDSKIVRVTPQLQRRYKLDLKIAPEAKVMLVAGGGLGSQRLNELMIKSAARLLHAVPDLHIIHITGQQHIESTKAAYADVLDRAPLARVVCLGFTPEFYKYSGAADLILSRAGATAIAEYAVQAKPCIIIPSPFLAGGHQLRNADELKHHDAAVILDDKSDSDELYAVAVHLLGDVLRRQELAANIAKLAKPGAAERLAQIILQQVEHEK